METAGVCSDCISGREPLVVDAWVPSPGMGLLERLSLSCEDRSLQAGVCWLRDSKEGAGR